MLEVKYDCQVYIACIGVAMFLAFLNVSSLILSFPSITECKVQADQFFVGNLPSMASPNDLTMYFSKLGPVVDFHLPATGRHRGFGFVKFKNGFDPYASSVPSMYMEGIALL